MHDLHRPLTQEVVYRVEYRSKVRCRGCSVHAAVRACQACMDSTRHWFSAIVCYVQAKSKVQELKTRCMHACRVSLVFSSSSSGRSLCTTIPSSWSSRPSGVIMKFSSVTCTNTQQCFQQAPSGECAQTSMRNQVLQIQVLQCLPSCSSRHDQPAWDGKLFLQT